MRIVLLTLVLLLFAGIAESRQNDSETIIYSSFNECVKTLKPESGSKDAIYEGWNDCVKTLQSEWQPEQLWVFLQDSYRNEPPEFVKSMDRMEKIKRLIELHEIRIKALKKMLAAEKM